MTESQVKLKGVAPISNTTVYSEEGAGGCSVGCFKVGARPTSADTMVYQGKDGISAEISRPESAKPGRNCNHSFNDGKVDNWKVSI